MKTLRSRVMLLGAALGLTLLLGTFLLKPAKEKSPSSGFPWAAAAGMAGIGVVAYLARKKSTSARQDQIENLTCRETLRLQPGKVLHLVEADNRRLLVSTSEQGVQLVCELDRTSQASAEELS